MNKVVFSLLLGLAWTAAVGCSGGDGSTQVSNGSNSCAQFFSEAKLCSFQCGLSTGTDASQVAKTLGVPTLAPGKGCAEEPGGGGSFSCLFACTDDPTGKQTNVDFSFDSGGHLYSISADYVLPQCVVSAGCR